jgi:hypothetical protein
VTSPGPGAVPVTAVVAAHNEGDQIGACVRSVSWAAEVLVVENDSTDETIQRATEAGATVFSHPFQTIGAQRNAAIARAAHPWVFVRTAYRDATGSWGGKSATAGGIGTAPCGSSGAISDTTSGRCMST